MGDGFDGMLLANKMLLDALLRKSLSVTNDSCCLFSAMMACGAL